MVMLKGFLNNNDKSQCYGCEACVQVCAHSALSLKEDEEGFRYPELNAELCVNCGLCHKVCSAENEIIKNEDNQVAFGGYALDEKIRCYSTSGGAFSCIVDTWCIDNYVIFGAESDGLEVRHSYITNKSEIHKFRKSKYSQSHIGSAYKDAQRFLKEGKNVLFSGTPCQIEGLYKYLSVRKTDKSKLLTIEVVCEGVPSPIYIRKMDAEHVKRFKSNISNIDYRFKDGKYDYLESKKKKFRKKGRWDFQVMKITLRNGFSLYKDRWFNPFWSIWLKHLMSRPSCYKCPFATKYRVADVTLGDLWGVHLYCPELYGHNGGSSLIVANTPKGETALKAAIEIMYGHYLEISDALRYQSPMRQCISMNPQRDTFMKDLRNDKCSINYINKKWGKKPSIKLLISKYIWGNTQKVWWWNLRNNNLKK